MRYLLPSSLPYVTGRLVSPEADSYDRLRAYAEGIVASLDQFGGMALSRIGFACTGSGYLIGRTREEEIAASLPVPIHWATHVILERLKEAGVRRLAIISPYPEQLHAAGLRYWQDAGQEIIFDTRIDIGTEDTRGIYALEQDAARGALANALATRPDAVLISGTGMPSLGLLAPEGQPPVFSSNYCLAWALIAAHEKVKNDD